MGEENVIRLPVKESEDSKSLKEDADNVRKYADMIEAGEIENFHILVIEKAEGSIISFCRFKDRLQLVGAVEYAKTNISEN